MKLVIILCAFIGYVYPAPSPCIELCGQVADVNSKTSGSLQTYQTHSSLSDRNSLRNLHQSLIDQLQKTHQVNLESTRPGNWTEHNDYVTDNGAGSVHEERGQVVNGGSEVRYYKKNYESSYGSGVSGVNNGGASSLTSDHLNIHNTIDRTNVQTHEQPSYYDQQNSHTINHSSGSSSIDNLARLENFGEQTDTQIHDSSNSGIVSNNDDNWTRHNSFATDGGRGKVYEEEGQYHQGPTKVRYYKKNYTSSFSTSGGDGSGVAMIPIVTVPNINAHIDAQMNQMRSQLEQVNGHINQQTRHLSTNIDNTNLNRDVHVQNDYHSRNHISTNQNVPVVDRVAVTRDEHHEKYSSSQNEHGINTHSNYEPIRVLPIQTQYVVPITHVESTNAHRQVEKQIYVPTSNINSQINSHSSQQQYQHQQRDNGDTTIRIPIYRRNDGIYIDGDSSSLMRNQQLNINENSRNENVYNQRMERILVQPQVERHVEQHWSASEHRSHSTLPQQIIFTNPQGISDSQHSGMLGQQQYGSLTLGGYDNVNRAKSNNYIAGSSSSYRQQYGTKSHRDNAHSETIEHGYHGAADCDDATHINYNSQHGTRYRRGADYSQHNEDLNQHNDQTIAKLELGKQNESDNLQQTQGYHNHDQTNQHNRFDDYTQQHTGNLEFESQQSSHGLEDFTQQQSGNLELGQQHQSPNGHLEFGQQVGNHDHHGHYDQYSHHNSHGHADQDSTQQSTHGFEDYTQQHTGNLELDQQHQSSHGQLESGLERNHDHREPYDQYRHHNSHGHADQDSTQQSTHGFEDYTQQHTGNLELDQQHQSSHGQLESGLEKNHDHREPYDQYRHHNPHGHADPDSTQQSTHGFEDYTQQHAGNLELDQQHTQQHQDLSQRNPHEFGGLTQQQSGNLQIDAQHQNGGLEFAQQTEHHAHYDHDRYNHFGNHDMQQQSGSHVFGQQHDQQQSGTQNYEQRTHGNYYGSQVQQTEDLMQQSQRGQSVIEQSSRNVHFGQQQSDELTQHTGNIGDFSQQTFGNLEVGHQTHNNDDLSQTNEHNYGSSLPAPKPVPRGQRIGYPERGDTSIKPISTPIGVKGGRRRVPGHQDQFNSHYSQPIVEQSEGVVSLEQQIRKDESVNVFQPRILEAYGGNGPYDANHNGNIYADVKPNPSATLAPIVDGKDSWDVRDTTTNDFFVKNGEAESIMTARSIKLDQEYNTPTTTTVAPGFWKRIGHKITSTYEKAKDKVADVFA